jgi:uncharacterized membrane protein
LEHLEPDELKKDDQNRRDQSRSPARPSQRGLSVRFREISPMIEGMFRAAGGIVLSCAMAVSLAKPATAALRLCNMTSSRIGVALGYVRKDGWMTEGWWNLTSRQCDVLLSGPLASQYYYIYAVDYERGGEWAGPFLMCIRDRAFTIHGKEDCLARGLDRAGFSEIDTGDHDDWIIYLTGDKGPARSSPNPPPITIPLADRHERDRAMARLRRISWTALVELR